MFSILAGMFILIILDNRIQVFYVAKKYMHSFVNGEKALQRDNFKLVVLRDNRTPLTCTYNYKGIIEGCYDRSGKRILNDYAALQTRSEPLFRLPFIYSHK